LPITSGPNSRLALANGATGAVRTQIEKTRASQQAEIGMVEAMLRGEPMMAVPAATDCLARNVKPGQVCTKSSSEARSSSQARSGACETNARRT
jgi:hypothetical protein